MCYSYGWDDQYYEYDESGAYEGWTQDESGEWKLDPAYKEYYESLELRTDNSSASKHGDKPTDNASSKPGALSKVKSSNKEPAHVKDLNKKNSEGKGSSNALYIPYGPGGSREGWLQDQYGQWYQDPLVANKINSNSSDPKGGKSSKNNDPKCAMPGEFTSRHRPPEYEDGWYEEPSDGQWYNTYDWYEDENGEWAYDYRMEEYGYIQTESGEWVPGPNAVEDPTHGPGQVPSGPMDPAAQAKGVNPLGVVTGGLGGLFGSSKGAASSSSKVPETKPQAKTVTDAATKPNGSLLQNGPISTNVSKASNGGKSVAKSEPTTAPKDGFSRLFSSDDPSVGPSQKTSLPPRPPDYDDYYYQTEDGNWYNEYDDLGYKFADDEILSVEVSGATRGPASLGEEESFYSEKELADAEKDLFKSDQTMASSSLSDQRANENNRTVTKITDSVKAVETKKPVIDKSAVVKSIEPAKEAVKQPTLGSAPSKVPAPSDPGGAAVGPPPISDLSKSKPASKKLPRPADYEDRWYMDFKGNWINEYDESGQEYEDDPLRDSTSDISVTERRPGKNVSFDQQSRDSDVREPERAPSVRPSPRQRWQWAFSRIAQVREIEVLHCCSIR